MINHWRSYSIYRDTAGEAAQPAKITSIPADDVDETPTYQSQSSGFAALSAIDGVGVGEEEEDFGGLMVRGLDNHSPLVISPLILAFSQRSRRLRQKARKKRKSLKRPRLKMKYRPGRDRIRRVLARSKCPFRSRLMILRTKNGDP